jgi:hypothetical protein
MRVSVSSAEPKRGLSVLPLRALGRCAPPADRRTLCALVESAESIGHTGVWGGPNPTVPAVSGPSATAPPSRKVSRIALAEPPPFGYARYCSHRIAGHG